MKKIACFAAAILIGAAALMPNNKPPQVTMQIQRWIEWLLPSWSQHKEKPSIADTRVPSWIRIPPRPIAKPQPSPAAVIPEGIKVAPKTKSMPCPPCMGNV
jgi:hypothetical protein